MRSIDEIKLAGSFGREEIELQNDSPRYQVVSIDHLDGPENYALINAGNLHLLMLASMELEHAHLEYAHLAMAAEMLNDAISHQDAGKENTRYIAEVLETDKGPMAFISDTNQPPAMNHARWLLLAPLGEIDALRLDVLDAAKTIAVGFNRSGYAYYAWLDPRNWTKEEQIEMLDSAFSPEASGFLKEWELLR